MDFEVLFGDVNWIRKLILSVLVMSVILGIRAATLRILEPSGAEPEDQSLKLRVRVRNASIMAILLGLIVVWAAELQTIAISAVAIAAAVVLATKELLLCLSGGILRATTEQFTVGDRVEIGPVRGDVIDYGFLTTTILEIGPSNQRTGRAVVIPNGLLLNTPVINLSFTDNYVLHSFYVPLSSRDNWEQDEQELLDAAREVCAAHMEAARKQMGELARRHSLSAASVEPRVTIQLPDPEKVNLQVRVPVPAREAGRYEQRVMRIYLKSRRRRREAEAAEAAEKASAAAKEGAPPPSSPAS